MRDREEPVKIDGARKVYTVSQITRLIKAAIEKEFDHVWIEGEISNLRQPTSGHCYFTIKDEAAQIRAVLFKSNLAAMKITPKDGMQARVFGEISVYERSGEYQIIVRVLEDSGKGALQAQFEALKEKLQKEGLFEQSRKRPIPLLPRCIGVVTSRSGAAIRDILNILSRRFANLHIVLADVRVQGEGAAEEIAGAIDLLNRIGGIDVMIVGRGGGSLEDLWCFNEEAVARAICRSGIPVISAVGHEIDFTISDFVADLRAPTPSAAAELVVVRKDDFVRRINEISRRLTRALKEPVLEYRGRFNTVRSSYMLREPLNIVKQYRERMGTLRLGLAHNLSGRLRETQQRVDDCSLKIVYEVKNRRQFAVQRVEGLSSHLNALNPLGVLARGYSITRDVNGRILRSADAAKQGQQIETLLGKGRLESKVTKTGAESPDSKVVMNENAVFMNNPG